MRSEVEQAIHRYAAGAFPMDDEEAPELPWYTAPERAIFELDEDARRGVRRKVRRDVRACMDFELRVDSAYLEVLALCAHPPDGEGIWITPRLALLYERLFAAGFAHSFELWTPDGELAAGILGVVIGRAAMLESMRKRRPAAGNALLVRTLDHLQSVGVELCDIQIPTPHTERLGCVLIPQDAYEARLHHALRGPDERLTTAVGGQKGVRVRSLGPNRATKSPQVWRIAAETPTVHVATAARRSQRENQEHGCSHRNHQMVQRRKGLWLHRPVGVR